MVNQIGWMKPVFFDVTHSKSLWLIKVGTRSTSVTETNRLKIVSRQQSSIRGHKSFESDHSKQCSTTTLIVHRLQRNTLPSDHCQFLFNSNRLPNIDLWNNLPARESHIRLIKFWVTILRRKQSTRHHTGWEIDLNPRRRFEQEF